MLDENILITDFDPDHWNRLISLFVRQESKDRSILLLMVENGHCLKAIHQQKGAMLNFDYGEGDLSFIAERESVDYIARISPDFFRKVFHAGQADVLYDDDYISQIMTIYNGVLSVTSEEIEWYPKRPHPFRQLNYEKAQKILNRFLPDGHTFFFCIIDDGRPYTSLILGKRSGDISLLTTLDALDAANEPFDPETQMEDILDRIEDEFEPVHLSLVIMRKSFEEMLAGNRPVTHLCAAIKHGRAYLTPLRFRLKLLLWAARVFKKL